MSESQSSYRQVMKATSIFGGVQVFNIIISIIRIKIIAILLGPVGIGLAGLFTSTINLIGGLTNFGLGTSAVKNVAEASGDFSQVSKTIIVIRRLVWATGLIGTILTFFLSTWLSELTFGNKDYSLAFQWLSINLVLTQLSKGQLVVLQGLRKLEHLAKANLYGNLLGLVITIPFYYLIGIKAIVPAMIVTTMVVLLFSWVYSRKIRVLPISISLGVTIAEGKSMLYLGIMISLSNVIALAASYGIRIFISEKGGIEQVGLFSSGFDIVNGYVGIILSAMAADYFPRLTAVAKDNNLCKKTINQQADIMLLLLGPLVVLIIIFIHPIITLLYSSKFIAIEIMIQWASLGLIFKASSWVIAYVLLAKGEGKLYFLNELIGIAYLTLLNVIGYHYMGLEGLGISFLCGYVVYFFQILILAKIRYNFSFEKSFVTPFLIQSSLTVSSLLVMMFIPKPYFYAFIIVLITISLLYTFYELNKRLNLKDTLNKLKHKVSK